VTTLCPALFKIVAEHVEFRVTLAWGTFRKLHGA
jgi:hypothetical protein